jgi:hypothetical protein
MLIVFRGVSPVLGRSRSVTAGGVVFAAVLFVVMTAVALSAPPALAGSPATVTVRVLGPAPSYTALIPPTQVTTTTAPVVNDGEPTHSCLGTSAAGALQLATAGDWQGKWFDEGEATGYFVETIEGTTPPAASSYWSFWLNNREATEGICESELEAGDQVLFFPECFGECPAPPGSTHVLGIEGPATAEVGQPTSVTVVSYNTKGERSPAAGVNVGGWGASATTNFEGKATVTFPGDETYTLRATGANGENPLAVPGEAVVCAHEGNDGQCGTSRPPGSLTASGGTTTTTTTTLTPPYTGPYAVVAAVTGIHEGRVYPRAKAPRVLTGTVSAHASVTSISLRLRRSYHGRCWAYSGSRERFERDRCGRGSFFGVASGGDSFSYLLPSRLPPGRYVLDIAASDSAGDHAPLDRGSSRVVFYVE